MLLNMDTMAAFCALLHYSFLGAWAGMASKVVTTARNALAAWATAKKIKLPKTLPLMFVGIYIILGIFTFNSVFSIFPILASSIYSIVIYTGDVKKIRYAGVVTCILWLVYDIYAFTIVGIVAEIIALINAAFAIYRFNNKKTRRH